MKELPYTSVRKDSKKSEECQASGAISQFSFFTTLICSFLCLTCRAFDPVATGERTGSPLRKSWRTIGPWATSLSSRSMPIGARGTHPLDDLVRTADCQGSYSS